MTRGNLCLGLVAFAGLLALVGLAGCGMVQGSAGTVAAPAVKATGMVHGGQNPVSDATIQLYAVGTTGYGSAATPLITTTTVTTSDGSGSVNTNANAGNQNNTLPAGSFTLNFTNAYKCPTASTLVYLTATGGNPGLTAGTNNSALVLVAALGQCGSLSSTTYVTINEVTTVGAVYALTPFIGATAANIGSASDSASLQAIANGFASVGNLVSNSSGSALLSTSGGNSVPQSRLDTLANTLVPCVNSTGPGSSACSSLFSAVTPSGGTAPATVLGALLDIALNPTNNVTNIYNLSLSNAAFEPVVTQAPNFWNVTDGGIATEACGGTNGDTVSGTVSYTGTKSGRIYVALVNNSGCDMGTMGTSISGPGAFTIRGVPPGTYTLWAFMDTMSFGVQNGIDPYGSFSPISVNSPNVTGATVTLTDPGSSPVTTAPTLTAVTGFDSGAVIQFKPAVNSNGTETPSSYTLQWSTTSTFSTIAGSKAFIATGPNIDVWFATTGLFDGNSYYFRAYGSSLGTPSGGPYSTVYGPVTIGAPSTGSSVSGAVSFTGTAIGPMYVGLYNPNVPGAVYLQYIANPVSSQAYTVTVPNSTTPVYVPVAFIDQNGTGVIEPGDITNVQIGLQGVPIAVTGNMANVNITLPSADSVALAITANKLTGSTESYGLTLYTNWLGKLPVGVTLEPSSNPDGANVTGPVDIASCSVPDNTNCNGFQLTFSLGTTVPTVGDTYLLNFKYSDGTSGLVAAPVTAVLNTFATNLGPTTGTSTPTFSWIGPVCSACNTYNYEFNIYIPNGNSIWYVPGNSTGLPYTTTSLTWGVDPTDSSNKPSPSSLTAGTTYDWSITVQDPYYNSATTIVSYTP